MRLINEFSEQKRAYTFCQLLEQKGIEALYELGKENRHSVWIIQEDDFEKARILLEEFYQLPEDQQMKSERPHAILKAPPTPMAKPLGKKGAYAHVRLNRMDPRMRGKNPKHPMTHFLLLICSLFFFWNLMQEGLLVKSEGKIALQTGITPLQQKLMIDYPQCLSKLEQLFKEHPLHSVDDISQLPPALQRKFAEADRCPYWRGWYEDLRAKVSKAPFQSSHAPSGPMFERIRQGEVWRLITPIFLHRDLLHILFNMSWLIFLGRQIEERLGKGKLLFLVVLIGIFSNVAQYLMSGPFFLGFSGVAVGFATFIWMRQRLAPWEGYPLSTGTVMFLLIFVLAMLVLDGVSLGMQMFGKTSLMGNIANTAHIMGGLAGVLLARIPFFAHNANYSK